MKRLENLISFYTRSDRGAVSSPGESNPAPPFHRLAIKWAFGGILTDTETAACFQLLWLNLHFNFSAQTSAWGPAVWKRRMFWLPVGVNCSISLFLPAGGYFVVQVWWWKTTREQLGAARRFIMCHLKSTKGTKLGETFIRLHHSSSFLLDLKLSEALLRKHPSQFPFGSETKLTVAFNSAPTGPIKCFNCSDRRVPITSFTHFNYHVFVYWNEVLDKVPAYWNWRIRCSREVKQMCSLLMKSLVSEISENNEKCPSETKFVFGRLV